MSRADTAKLPGVFETIATAASALIAQPWLLLLSIVVDVYLWLGVRLSPAAIALPLRQLAAGQPGAEAAWLTEGLTESAQSGDLAVVVGLFIPSLVTGLGTSALPGPWPRPVLDPGGLGASVLLAVGLAIVGVTGLMTLGAMLARVVRGVSPLGDRLARSAVLATARYLAFQLMAVLAIAILVVPASLVGGLLLLFGLNLMPLILLVCSLLAITAVVVFAFVGEAILVAEVGPLRAMALSFGVVQRNPWTTLGLLAVLWIVLLTVPELVGRLTETSLGIALAIVTYAFVATSLALARIQFFADRLAYWRAGAPPVRRSS